MEEKKEVLTEVTSVADQELKTGNKIPIPSEEELVQKASASLVSSLTSLDAIFRKLSSRGKTRAMLAILNIPMDGIPVKLRSKEEQLAFAYGQRAITDRFLITQFHINKEVRKHKKQMEEQAKETKTDPEKENTDGISKA